MSFTDQQRWVVSAEDCKCDWGCGKNGSRFRCYICGHRFAAGDGCRWVYTGGESHEIAGQQRGVSNLMTCDACDGPDVIEKWVQVHRDYASPRFWALRRTGDRP